ncbi:hypothetical protein LMG27952_05737 [Paraburkholderia hiiakae]|uniref:Uncharacterized protein n=1 Tax=Paraburkholderia hiiakae TaxID=1081782 RepID=A0ABN7IAG3_9BURK|nr:hypothetical protein LMG27952_05737 [Paraburkholderia hiiakae]
MPMPMQAVSIKAKRCRATGFARLLARVLVASIVGPSTFIPTIATPVSKRILPWCISLGGTRTRS